jgi:hypothetical protein
MSKPVEIKVDHTFHIKKRGQVIACTETDFPLGHVFNAGDKVKVEGKVRTIKECDPFYMMHIDERTNKAALGWCMILE